MVATLKSLKHKVNKYTDDELLFKDIQNTFKMKHNELGHTLSIYLAMHGLRQGVYIVSRAAKKDITNFVNRYKEIYHINYMIYAASTPFKGMYRIFLSTKQQVPNHLVGVNDKLNHSAIGKFLGYPCPRDLNKSSLTSQKITFFTINIKLNNPSLKTHTKITQKRKSDNKHLYQIFGFTCPSNEINKANIKKELDLFCAKVNEYCQPKFKNLLPGLHAYNMIMN